MFRGSIPLGRLFGIRFAVSPSWLVIFALVWASLALGYLPLHYPRLPGIVHWLAGLAACLLFFVCVLLHELAHSLLALKKGLPVRGITLFMLGGVSNIGREAPSPGVEFFVALVGPLTSLAIGGAIGALVLAVQPGPPLRDLLFWLAYVNVSLALFNLLPGFPLDGGRLLRAIFWFASEDFAWATRAATRAGQIGALIMVGGGAYLLIERRSGSPVTGIWLMLLGWFLFTAARNSRYSSLAVHALQGLCARDIMRPDPATARADQPVEEVAGQLVDQRAGRSLVVLEAGAPVGLLQSGSLRTPNGQPVPGSVASRMTPLRPGLLLRADLPAGEALQELIESGLPGLPVVADGRLVGLLTQVDVFRVIELRRRLDGQAS